MWAGGARDRGRYVRRESRATRHWRGEQRRRRIALPLPMTISARWRRWHARAVGESARLRFISRDARIAWVSNGTVASVCADAGGRRSCVGAARDIRREQCVRTNGRRHAEADGLLGESDIAREWRPTWIMPRSVTDRDCTAIAPCNGRARRQRRPSQARADEPELGDLSPRRVSEFLRARFGRTRDDIVTGLFASFGFSRHKW